MDTFWLDLRFSLRTLSKRPVFTLIAVVSLALGIGANVAIFSLLREVFWQPIPIQDPERVVVVYGTDQRVGDIELVSHHNWRDLREQNTVLEDLGGYTWSTVSVSTEGEPLHVTGSLVSGNYFDILGVSAVLGRTLSPRDDVTPGAHPVVVLSHHFWSSRLGLDPDVVGRKLRINGHPFTVVGVMSPEFKGLLRGYSAELWVPFAMNQVAIPDPAVNWFDRRIGKIITPVGRLAEGLTLAEADARFRALGDRLALEYPESLKGRGFRLVPAVEAAIPVWAQTTAKGGAAVLAATVGLVLLIACLNIANLLLARARERRKEIAVRLALGVGRGRLVRQLLTESVVTALAGGVLGLAVARWTQDALLNVLGSMGWWGTFNLEVALDPSMLAFLFLLSVVTGLLFGLVPAIQSSRPELVNALKASGDARPVNDRVPWIRGLDFRNVLVVAQVALSLVALVAAGLFLRSFDAARGADPGFDADKLAVASFDVALQGYSEEQGKQFFQQVVEQTRSLPGIESATLAQYGPISDYWYQAVTREGEATDPTARTIIQANSVLPGYFETLGITVEEGRGFQSNDRDSSVSVAVVNRTMATQFFPGEKAVGKRLVLLESDTKKITVEIVGVARDADYNLVGEAPQPFFYLPLMQYYVANATLITRTAGEPAAVLRMLTEEIHAIDPGIPVVDVRTVGQVVSASMWAPRFVARFLGIFGAVALVLTAIGLYGVMLYAVTRRTREIGIRVALGAERRSVLALVLRQSLAMVALGLALGLTTALLASRLVTSMLYVKTTDPLAYLGTIALMVAVAFAASLVPALRAMAVDPIRALRSD